MQDRVLGDYGGPFEDALPVEDPETQLAAAQYNRLAEDVAQLTRAGLRAVVRFRTTTGTAPSVQQACSVWGNGSSQHPTITRTGTGLYTVTYAASFADELGQVEDVAFSFCMPQIEGPTPGHVRLASISGNSASIAVFSSLWTASDLGGSAPITLWFR